MNHITSVLIMAAGQLPDRQLGPAPLLHPHPLDLPAGSDLAIQRISKHHRKYHPKAELVAVMDQRTQSHYKCLERLVDRCLSITPQTSICASIETALHKLQVDFVIVNPITSLPSSGPMQSTSLILGKTPLKRENWSAFSDQNPCGRYQLLSKLMPPALNEPCSFPFTGLLAANKEDLLEVIKQLSTDQQHDLGWIGALLLEQHNARVVLAPWYDLGHRASYARSRLSQLASRSHNQVSYNEVEDLIQKRSTDQNRLSAEAAYLHKLPSKIKRHFPALINYSKSLGLELEYIPFPSLTELFLHWEINPEGWRRIWHRLGCILDELRNNENSITGNCSWLYGQKMKNRLNQMTNSPPDIRWQHFWNTPLKLNGRKLPAPSQCAELVLKSLEELEVECPLHRIHGDLCFNNILAEPLHASLRLIDPRGETAENNQFLVGYGDPRYDLVKLLHSGYYYYDLIVHELYELHKRSDASWNALLIPPRQASIIGKQLHGFVQKRGLSAEEERWLTASLFFSMLPLHSDNLRRQQMLCLVGCCISQPCFTILLP